MVFVCGLYIAALFAGKKYTFAKEKLDILTRFVKISRINNYIAALVAGKKYAFAKEKLDMLIRFVKIFRTNNVDFGFNEWIKALDGNVMR